MITCVATQQSGQTGLKGKTTETCKQQVNVENYAQPCLEIQTSDMTNEMKIFELFLFLQLLHGMALSCQSKSR